MTPRARAIAIVFGVALVAGALDVHYTRGYLDHLTELARTDKAAAMSGFKTWVLPQLVVVAAIGVVVGGWTIREGIRAYRREGEARRVGIGLVLVGTILATVPTLIVAVVLALIFRR